MDDEITGNEELLTDDVCCWIVEVDDEALEAFCGNPATLDEKDAMLLW
jgi:hypothetical protein